jgi:hypothetical protein
MKALFRKYSEKIQIINILPFPLFLSKPAVPLKKKVNSVYQIYALWTNESDLYFTELRYLHWAHLVMMEFVMHLYVYICKYIMLERFQKYVCLFLNEGPHISWYKCCLKELLFNLEKKQ